LFPFIFLSILRPSSLLFVCLFISFSSLPFLLSFSMSFTVYFPVSFLPIAFHPVSFFIHPISFFLSFRCENGTSLEASQLHLQSGVMGSSRKVLLHIETVCGSTDLKRNI